MKRSKQIGVVGNWSNMNYGAQLTYYALYQTLMDEGFCVTMIEGAGSNRLPDEVLAPKLFRENPYHDSSLLKGSLSELVKLNEEMNSFVVGSDQLWRYIFFKKTIEVNILSFVSADKRKISYATSFGEKEFHAPVERIEKMKYFLNRFQKISVREQSGVEICKNTFGVDAEWVLDPVFLCDVQHYEMFVNKAVAQMDEPFVFVYIVHPSEEKRIFVENIVSRIGKKAVFVRSLSKKAIYEGWNIPDEHNCKIEEWLYYIKNCDRVITDSFHAYCFSVIFNKQIIPLFQTVDGKDSAERVFSLANILGMEAPEMMEYLEIERYYGGEKNIDYSDVNKRLNEERVRCRQWLLDALETEVFYDKTDLLWDVIRPEIYKMRDMEYRLAEQQREIIRLKHADRNVVLFGAGNVLQKHGKEICKNINVCGIVDNNPEKFGILYEGITCTTPEALLEIDAPYVLITVKNEMLIESIRAQLESLGIRDYALLSEWMEI